VDEGPHPKNIQRVPGDVCRGSALPALQPWYFGESWVAQLNEGAQDRVARWKARWDARIAGGPVLSLTELGRRIKQTQQLVEIACTPGDVAALSVQLEDMKREFDWRTFLEVDTTIWPAEPQSESAEM
jgi:hypothetical protein